MCVCVCVYVYFMRMCFVHVFCTYCMLMLLLSVMCLSSLISPNMLLDYDGDCSRESINIICHLHDYLKFKCRLL